MRWTDFCHLTSSYQYPRIVGSPCIRRLRAGTVEEIACFHDSATRFGGPAQTCLLAHLIAAGVFFPSRCVHALPLTPLSPLPSGLVTLARARTLGSRLGHLQDRPRERATRETTRDDFHLAKASAPRCPFGHPARAYPGAVALPPRYRLSTPLLTRGALESTTSFGPPSACPDATGRASLSLGVVRRLLQPNSTRGHTRQAVDPRPPVRLSPHFRRPGALGRTKG